MRGACSQLQSDLYGNGRAGDGEVRHTINSSRTTSTVAALAMEDGGTGSDKLSGAGTGEHVPLIEVFVFPSPSPFLLLS